MSKDSKQLLKRQLEQQARLFGSSKDGTELVLSILATCSVLLKAVEKEIPADLSQVDAEGIFAGYLGVTGRAAGFYKKRSSDLDRAQSEQLQSLLQAMKEEENRKQDLERKIVQAEEQNRQSGREIQTAEQLLEAEKQKQQILTEKEGRLQSRLEEMRKTAEALTRELESLKEQTENLESSIERLTQEVASARETSEELRAYYSEVQRIEAGMKEEGYVDLNSLNERIQAMNETGENLMKEYDSLLANLSADVEALQTRIEKRRKPGLAG